MSVFGSLQYDESTESALSSALSSVLGFPVDDLSLVLSDRPMTAEEAARVSALSGVPSFSYYYQSDYVEGPFGLIVVEGGSVVRSVSMTPEEYWESIKDDAAVQEALSALVAAGFDEDCDVRDFLMLHLDYKAYPFLDPLGDYLFYYVLR